MRNSRSSSTPRRRKTKSIRSAPASGCACIPKTASRRLTRSWTFDATTTRMPEFTAPGIGRESNIVTVEAEFGDKATGVLYALGGSSGGVTCYMDQGQAELRIQPDDHRALQGADGGDSRRQTRHRSRNHLRQQKAALARRRRDPRGRQGSRPHNGQDAPCPPPSRRAKPSTSASTSAPLLPSNMRSAARSSSTGRSGR